MTRKDYILLAGAIRRARLCPDCMKRIVDEIGCVLAEDNWRFDWHRWLVACYPPEDDEEE
jgi:hypothetical protein